MRLLRRGLSCSREPREMRMHRLRLIWRESLTMTRIRCAAITSISMARAVIMKRAAVGIIADKEFLHKI